MVLAPFGRQPQAVSFKRQVVLCGGASVFRFELGAAFGF